MVGGLLIGLIGLVFPQIFGVGYETVDSVLNGTIGLNGTNLVTLLLALVVIKLLATSISAGSGASGGIFSPSLFIGAMLGGAVGTLANMYFPETTGPAGAYAVVGMAALYAGAGRATFTSMIIIFEMTLDYHLILPVMFACVVSDAVSSVLTRDTIYTLKLRKKGVRILHDMEVNLLEALTVKDAMVPCQEVVCVPEDMTIGEVYGLILKTEHMGFPVMNKTKKCCGIITFHDVDRAMSNGYMAEPARWFCTRRPVVTYRGESLEDCLQKMQAHEISHLPVVSRKNKKKLRGFITKGDIMRTYAKKHMKKRLKQRARK
jgi:CIC family chloride channel protein